MDKPTEERVEEQEKDMYKQYRRKQIAELADWHPEFDMTGVSISEADVENGSPKLGDKIARNPKSHKDKWLVADKYFADNFEPAGHIRQPEPVLTVLSDEEVDVIVEKGVFIDFKPTSPEHIQRIIQWQHDQETLRRNDGQ